jgi:hypothetical protein
VSSSGSRPSSVEEENGSQVSIHMQDDEDNAEELSDGEDVIIRRVIVRPWVPDWKFSDFLFAQVVDQ